VQKSKTIANTYNFRNIKAYNDIYFDNILSSEIITWYIFYIDKYQTINDIICNIINNNIYITIYQQLYFSTSGYNDEVIICIKKNIPYIKCGISLNIKYTMKLYYEIISSSKIIHNESDKISLMNLFNIKNISGYGDSDIKLIYEYIKNQHMLIDYKNMMEMCYKYILYKKHRYDVINIDSHIDFMYKIMLDCFKKYIIFYDPVKFIDKILHNNLYLKTIYHNYHYGSGYRYTKYEGFMKNENYNIYKIIMKDIVISNIYPNMSDNIIKFWTNKLDTNEEKIKIQITKISNYQHNDGILLEKVNKYIINPPINIYQTNFTINITDLEFKKIFTKIRKLINESIFYQINLRLCREI